MKKMWKIRKDKSAVSPVIATILMVAITVVLAAVLYVMVMGFGGSTASTAPAVTLQKNGNVVTISINPQTADSKMAIAVVGGATVQGTFLLSSASPVTGIALAKTNTGQITTGDTLTITQGVGATLITSIQLVYVPSGVAGTDKQMVGNVITF